MTTCPYDPRERAGMPVGMYHCPICGRMIVAGMAHPDYSVLDEPSEPTPPAPPADSPDPA